MHIWNSKKTFVFFMCLSFKSNSQGIEWTQLASWNNVVAKAQAEKKYIFVDAYATWCGPCKKMDKEVYTSGKVGEEVNSKFISVKLQMDSTAKDGAEIQRWYATATEFRTKYKISGFPSFLFFSPEGELVHSDLGYKSVDEMILLAQRASNPLYQDSKLIEAYKEGSRKPEILRKAAKAAKKLKLNSLADSIANDYKKTYLDKLSDLELYTKENILFFAKEFPALALLEGSSGRIFQYIYHNPQKIDTLFDPGTAKTYVKWIINFEELSNKLILSEKVVYDNPNWDSLKYVISGKYTAELAEEIVESYKPSFYRAAKNWLAWSKLFDAKVQKHKRSLQKNSKLLGRYGDTWELNSMAWTAFLQCKNKPVLKRALKWVDLAIKLEQGDRGIEEYYDTKANLLYKLGRRKSAIKNQQYAIQLHNAFAIKDGEKRGESENRFKATLVKMQSRVPTWND